MPVGSSNRRGPERSVAEVVAEWRLRCEQGEAVDSRQMLDDIEQARQAEGRNESLSPHDFPDVAPPTDEPGLSPTVVVPTIADLPSTPTGRFEKPQSRRKARFLSPTTADGSGRDLDDYDVLREIAQGGMGVVYEARQKSLNRIVALKMIKAAELANEEEVARFYAEAEAAANLRHPNIVAVYEVGRAGEHADQHYFTMDYIGGPSLLQLIRKQPLAPRDAAQHVAKIARAVQFAHERNVLHRDLKPSNILLSDDGEPLVTDFGLAKRVDQDMQLTMAGAVIGTPAYMPPEQARGDQRGIGPAADIYSLGAILYECVTGRPPFVSSSLTEMLSQVLEDEPLPPSKLISRLPRDYETICLKCLEKLPKNRYTTAGDLADDLERFLRDEPILARPVGTVERALKFARRKPAWAGLMSAALLFAAVLAITVGVYTRQLSNKNQELNESMTKLATSNADLRQTYYAAMIDKAEDYWSRDPRNLYRGKMLLNSLKPQPDEPDLRGFEWYFLDRLCNFDKQVVYQGKGEILHLTCQPDGSLYIHDAGQAHPLLVASGPLHEDPVPVADVGRPQRVQFTPNCQWCLVWTDDWKLEIRKRESLGQTDLVIGSGNERNTRASLANDGQVLAILAKGQPAAFWQRSEPNRFRAFGVKLPDPVDVRISPDGKWGAVMGKEAFAITETGAPRDRIVRFNGLRRYTAIAFSPDSSRLALASAQGQIDLVLLGEPLQTRSIKWRVDYATPTAMAFVPHSTRLAIGSSNSQIFVFDLKDGQNNLSEDATFVYRGHAAGVTRLAADPNGKFLYSAAADGQILRWDLTIKDQRTHDIVGQVGEWFTHFHCLQYSLDGRWLAAGGTGYETGTKRKIGDLLLIDVATRKHRSLKIDPGDPVVHCGFSPDSRQLLFGCRPEQEPHEAEDMLQQTLPCRFSVWNLPDDKPAPGYRELESVIGACYGDGQLVVANAAGKLTAASDSMGMPRTWPISTAASPPVRLLAASANGKVVVSYADDRTLTCWASPAGRKLWSSPKCGEPLALAVSHQGNLVAATIEGNAITGGKRQAALYEVGHDRPRIVFGGHSSPISALCISADGTRVVSGDREGVLKVWDSTPRVAGTNDMEARELMTIENAHAGGVQSIAMHPGGRQLASIGTRDALVRIWWTE